jgi:hypothetical protein
MKVDDRAAFKGWIAVKPHCRRLTFGRFSEDTKDSVTFLAYSGAGLRHVSQ